MDGGMMYIVYGHAPFNLPHWRIGVFIIDRSIWINRCNESVWIIPGTIDE